jgi:hypothetical protein
MIRNHPSRLVTLVIWVLGALPLLSMGDPTSEHNMAGMAHGAGELTPAMLGSVFVRDFMQAAGQGGL